MSKREDLPSTSPTEESKPSDKEDTTYGFSQLKVSEASSPKSPQQNGSKAEKKSSDPTLPSTSGSIPQRNLPRPTTLKLAILSEAEKRYITDGDILSACCTPSSSSDTSSPQDHKSLQEDIKKRLAAELVLFPTGESIPRSSLLSPTTPPKLSSPSEEEELNDEQVLAACYSAASIRGGISGLPSKYASPKKKTPSPKKLSTNISPFHWSPNRNSPIPNVMFPAFSPVRRSPQRDSSSPRMRPINLESLRRSPQIESGYRYRSLLEASGSSSCRDLFPSSSLPGSPSQRLFSSEGTLCYPSEGHALATSSSPHSVKSESGISDRSPKSKGNYKETPGCSGFSPHRRSSLSPKTQAGPSSESPKSTRYERKYKPIDFSGNIVPNSYVKDQRVYQVCGTSFTQFGGEAAALPSRYQLNPISFSQPSSPDSPGKRQWNPNTTDPSSIVSYSSSGGIIRSYTIKKPWNPKRPGSSDDSSEIRREKILESYSRTTKEGSLVKSPEKKQEVMDTSPTIKGGTLKNSSKKVPKQVIDICSTTQDPSKVPEWSVKYIDTSGKVLSSSPSPSGGTYTVEKSWSSSSDNDRIEFPIKDECVFQISSPGYSRIGIPFPGSGSPSTKKTCNIRQTGSEKILESTTIDERVFQISSPGHSRMGIPSPSSRSPSTKNARIGQTTNGSPTSPSGRGILRKMKTLSRLSDSSETSSPEKQRQLSNRTLSPSEVACIFTPKASPETSRSSTPLYSPSKQESPKRVKFSKEPDEIADIDEVVEEKEFF